MTDVYRTDLGAYNSPFGSSQLLERRVHRAVRGRGRVRRAPGGADQQDADRRLPRLRPAGGRTSPASCSSTGWPGVSASTRSSCGLQNMLSPTSCPGATRPARSTTAATTSAACGWPPTPSATSGHRPTGRGPRRGRPLRRHRVLLLRGAHRLRQRAFLAGRGSQFGAHESVTLRANRSGGVDLYTGRVELGQGSETAFAQVCADVPRDRLRRHPRARRRHRRLAR